MSDEVAKKRYDDVMAGMDERLKYLKKPFTLELNKQPVGAEFFFLLAAVVLITVDHGVCLCAVVF